MFFALVFSCGNIFYVFVSIKDQWFHLQPVPSSIRMDEYITESEAADFTRYVKFAKSFRDNKNTQVLPGASAPIPHHSTPPTPKTIGIPYAHKVVKLHPVRIPSCCPPAVCVQCFTHEENLCPGLWKGVTVFLSLIGVVVLIIETWLLF